MTQPVISPLPSNSQNPYDLMFCALGYETRACYVPKKHSGSARECVAIGFDYHITGAVESNYTILKEAGCFNWTSQLGLASPHVSDDSFRQVIARCLAHHLEIASNQAFTVGVDISSLSFVRLAIIVEELCFLVERRENNGCEVTVDFLYAIGEDHGTSDEVEQIAFAGPVSDGFAGWSSDPSEPVVAIFGLGFEYEKSIGAFELLNPASTYAFATTGTNKAHDDRIGLANELFLPLVPPEQRFAFDAARPMDCYHKLRSVASGALRDGRPVLVPQGPKIFGLCCLLIAREYFPRMSVWRISTGKHGKPVEVSASGKIVGVRVSLNSLFIAARTRRGVRSASFGVKCLR